MLTFGVYPFLLLGWWVYYDDSTLYEWLTQYVHGWVKFYLVVWGASWFTICIMFKQKQRYFFTAYIIIAINIIVAVLFDIFVGNDTIYLNAIAGMLLVITLPKANFIRVDDNTAHPDLLWDIPLAWILGYSLWNITLAYMHGPHNSGIHVAVLGSALIIGLIDNQRWMQARAFTLGTFVVLVYTHKPMFQIIEFPNLYNETIALLASTLSLGWMMRYTIIVIWQKKKRSINHEYPSIG